MTDQYQEPKIEYRQSTTRRNLIAGTWMLLGLFLLATPTRALMVLPAIVVIAQIVSYYSIGIRLEKDHIVLTTGIISKKTDDVPYKKINTISVKQGLVGRILDYGTIVIYTGNDSSGIKVVGIDEPNDLKRAVKQLMDK